MSARVTHFEVHAEDPGRAAKFYADAFGWEVVKWEGPMDYWLVTTGPEGEPGIDGGITRREAAPGGAVSSYVCTLAVDDLDASIAKVTAGGGTVTSPKQAVPGVGWLAYAKDTEGNVFGMMQNDPAAA